MVEAWLSEIILKLSRRLLVRSSISSTEFALGKFLDDEDRDEEVRCQVKYFTVVSGGAEQKC